MKITGKEIIAQGNWLSLDKLKYIDVHNHERTWESVSRRKSGGAVIMLAELIPSGKIILIRQFRPPADSFVIEFPAGLIEPDESPETAARRELKEETGYIGEVVSVSEKMYNSPGLTSEFVIFVKMKIDEGKQGALITDFDESEDIHTYLADADSLADFLNGRIQEGDSIDAKVYSYALALGK